MIALIVTIIIMLILSVVSVQAAINNGLFTTAKKAIDKTGESYREEQNYGGETIQNAVDAALGRTEAEGYPCMLEASRGESLIDYKIYGNSEQNGTPTPSNPIPVYSLGERTRNLFSGTLEMGTIASSTGVLANSTTRVRTVDYITLPSETYIVFTLDKNIVVKTYDIDNNYILSESSSDWVSGFTRTFTISETRKVKFVFRFPDDRTITTSDVTNIQLEQGSSATRYVPYNAIEVKSSGKNLYNSNYSTITTNNVGTVDFNDGVYKYSLPNAYSGLKLTLSEGHNLLPGTYTISLEAKKENISSNIQLRVYDNITTAYRDTQTDSVKSTEWQTVKTVFTVTNAEHSLTVWCLPYTSNGVSNDAFLYINANSIQIEQGSTATDYEPYQAPKTTVIDLTGHEPLRKIGDVSDYIDYANGRIVRNIGKVVLDGANKRISAVNLYSNNLYYALYYDLGAKTTNPLPMVSHFTSSGSTVTLGNSYITSLENYLSMVNTDQTLDTVAKWNGWLIEQYTAGTPVIAYYQLATPTYEAITLPSIPTQNGTSIETATDCYLDSSRIYAKYSENTSY